MMTKPTMAVAALLMFVVPSATAGPIVLDQTNDSDVTQGLGIARGVVHAQTFTVGVTGSLVGVNLVVTGVPTSEELLAYVLRTENGVPVGEFADATYLDLAPGYLATTTAMAPVPPQPNPAKPALQPSQGWVSFDFSLAPVTASAGDVLAIALLSRGENIGAGQHAVFTSSGNYYERGGVFSLGASDWIPQGGGQEDFLFQTVITPIPEPASLALVGSGACLLLTLRRRRRR